MATKKEQEKAQDKPLRLVYVGVPDVVTDAELEHLQADPRWSSIEAIATERNKEWHKETGGKMPLDISQVAAQEAAEEAEQVAPAVAGESEVSGG